MVPVTAAAIPAPVQAIRRARASLPAPTFVPTSVTSAVPKPKTIGIWRYSRRVASPYPAKAVMIVDEKATTDQRAALVAFAQEMGGGILDTVVRTEVAPIAMAVSHGHHEAKGTLQAGDLAQIETRAVAEKDKHCGNEDVYYPPLASTTHAMPAVAVTDQWNGAGLGVSWTTHDKRNAFVGSFAR